GLLLHRQPRRHASLLYRAHRRRPVLPCRRHRGLLERVDDDPHGPHRPASGERRRRAALRQGRRRAGRRIAMKEFFHRKIERNAIGFVLAIVGVASIGGIVEIAPLFTISETVEEAPDMRLYTPLELAGRNIYIREGCYACHSQMIRTLRDEVERY